MLHWSCCLCFGNLKSDQLDNLVYLDAQRNEVIQIEKSSKDSFQSRKHFLILELLTLNLMLCEFFDAIETSIDCISIFRVRHYLYRSHHKEAGGFRIVEVVLICCYFHKIDRGYLPRRFWLRWGFHKGSCLRRLDFEYCASARGTWRKRCLDVSSRIVGHLSLLYFRSQRRWSWEIWVHIRHSGWTPRISQALLQQRDSNTFDIMLFVTMCQTFPQPPSPQLDIQIRTVWRRFPIL